MASAKTPHDNLRYLKGIGPKRAQALEKVGVRSVRDLLYYFPRRYEDRSKLTPISEIKPGSVVTFRARILAIQLRRIRRLNLLEVLVGDEHGSIKVLWFNQPYLKGQLSQGDDIVLHGKADLQGRTLQLNSPEFEILEPSGEMVHVGRITPVYPLTGGLFQRSMRATMAALLTQGVENYIQEYLPAHFRQTHDLMDLVQAIHQMHFPESIELQSHARARIAFDEFLLFQITLLKKIENLEKHHRSISLPAESDLINEFSKHLPFDLTVCQKDAMHAISKDLLRTRPMNRLVMGDVGSGKTLVAFYALLHAIKNGRQCVFMAPTEILAQQHYENAKAALGPFKAQVRLLTASTKKKDKEKIYGDIKENRVSCVVGTHALLSQNIEFQSLSLVVIDEQHKFGVHQRSSLFERDPRPHQLVMTATPIPRTLALTVYADMDVSAMRERPQGRKEIKTYWITRAKQKEVLKHILERTKKGEQAYFIFPMIDETEKTDLLAAKNEYEKLRAGMFKHAGVGLVHGKMGADERDAVMEKFKSGACKVLVATSVIEVGVDNPNATMMVIENAERFGLSQLHQMRGRIGRGGMASTCFLFGEPSTDQGKLRLRILTKTQDGFLIAEEDLRLRGPGDFWGTRQSGEPLFKVAHPHFDQRILMKARACALDLVRGNRLSTMDEWGALKKHLDQYPINY